MNTNALLTAPIIAAWMLYRIPVSMKIKVFVSLQLGGIRD
jgi:hypothetical protein